MGEVKNPFKQGDHVYVSCKYVTNAGANGYICGVNEDIVTVKFKKETVPYEQEEWAYHFSNLDFFRNTFPKTEDPTRNESLWCIFKEKGDAPRKMHSTYQAAKDELERLAKATPGHKFYLLEAIEELSYEMKYERKELKYTQEHQ